MLLKNQAGERTLLKRKQLRVAIYAADGSPLSGCAVRRERRRRARRNRAERRQQWLTAIGAVASEPVCPRCGGPTQACSPSGRGTWACDDCQLWG